LPEHIPVLYAPKMQSLNPAILSQEPTYTALDHSEIEPGWKNIDKHLEQKMLNNLK